MKFILFTFLTALVVITINPFLPYWSVMIVLAIFAATISKNGVGAFFAGGLGMGLVWLGQSIYVTSISGSQLPAKMGDLMGVGSEVTLFAVTGFLGFLLGAFSTLSGRLLRNLVKRKPDNIYGR